MLATIIALSAGFVASILLPQLRQDWSELLDAMDTLSELTSSGNDTVDLGGYDRILERRLTDRVADWLPLSALLLVLFTLGLAPLRRPEMRVALMTTVLGLAAVAMIPVSSYAAKNIPAEGDTDLLIGFWTYLGSTILLIALVAFIAHRLWLARPEIVPGNGQAAMSVGMLSIGILVALTVRADKATGNNEGLLEFDRQFDTDLAPTVVGNYFDGAPALSLGIAIAVVAFMLAVLLMAPLVSSSQIGAGLVVGIGSGVLLLSLWSSVQAADVSAGSDELALDLTWAMWFLPVLGLALAIVGLNWKRVLAMFSGPG
jgi:hypothetical protein